MSPVPLPVGQYHMSLPIFLSFNRLSCKPKVLLFYYYFLCTPKFSIGSQKYNVNLSKYNTKIVEHVYTYTEVNKHNNTLIKVIINDTKRYPLY